MFESWRHWALDVSVGCEDCRSSRLPVRYWVMPMRIPSAPRGERSGRRAGVGSHVGSPRRDHEDPMTTLNGLSRVPNDCRDGASEVRLPNRCGDTHGTKGARRSTCDGVTPSTHRRPSCFRDSGGSLAGYGCPSLKTKSGSAGVRSEHAAVRALRTVPRARQRKVSWRESRELDARTSVWSFNAPIGMPKSNGLRYGFRRREVRSRRFAKPKSSTGLRSEVGAGATQWPSTMFPGVCREI